MSRPIPSLALLSLALLLALSPSTGITGLVAQTSASSGQADAPQANSPQANAPRADSHQIVQSPTQVEPLTKKTSKKSSRHKSGPAQPPSHGPTQIAGQESIPDIRQLMTEVMDHQKQLEKIRENYTYRTSSTTQDLDGSGQVTKTETADTEVFFVNTHHIERTVKKDGKPLSDHEQQKEQERVNKLVEKASKVPPGQPVDGPNMNMSVSKLLEIMDAFNPRREIFRGRSTIIFDFAGRHDAKTHGMAEDASKKIAGTLWVDERDRQVARMEAHFTDNFHVAGGLLANIQKGSSFYFDQAPVNGEIWFPTGAEGRIEARVLLVKGVRQHVIERDFDYERFSVDAEQGKSATVVPTPKS